MIGTAQKNLVIIYIWKRTTKTDELKKRDVFAYFASFNESVDFSLCIFESSLSALHHLDSRWVSWPPVRTCSDGSEKPWRSKVNGAPALV